MKRPTSWPSPWHLLGALPVLLGPLTFFGCSDRASGPARDGGASDVGPSDQTGEIAQQDSNSPADGEAGSADALADVSDTGDVADGGAAVDVAQVDSAAPQDGPSPDAGCTPGAASCISTAASHVCDEEGRTSRDVACPLGCLADGPRAGACREIVPSNGFTGLTCGDDKSSLVSFDVREDTELDPDHGSYSTVTSTILAAPAFVAGLQGGSAPSVGIFHLAHLTVYEGQTLTIRRSAAAAVVFLVDGDVTIDGTLDVGARGNASGAGASLLGAGAPITSLAGAGGGAFGTLGSAGGMSDGIKGGPSGIIYGNASLVPLFGGSPGGGGTLLMGGGGGAVQISACGSVRVGPHGVVRASGGGAQPGSGLVPGAGGGAGGAVLIEARTVSIEGIVTANGGAGAGASTLEAAGTSGEDGSLLATQPASPGRNSAGGEAGTGSCAARPAGDAEPTMGGLPSGGGGGGLGRINVATMGLSSTVQALSLDGIVSPAPTVDTWLTR